MAKRKAAVKAPRAPEAPVAVRLGADLMQQLRAEWKRTGLPISEQIRQAVRQWLATRKGQK